MITKNAKNISMIAVAVSLVAISMVGFNLVSGQSGDTEVKGVTIIEPDPVQSEKEDRTELIALEDAFNKADTDEERERIKAEAAELLREQVPLTNLEKAIKHNEAKDMLGEAIHTMPRQDNGHAAIPYTSIGHDTKTGLLTIEIHQDFATLDNMKEYEKTIRSVIGDEIDLKISNGGEYWILGDCPNGPLNDCNPLESSIEMQVTNQGKCTIGMRATYGGDEGFVTAGHCVDDETGSNVGQDSPSSVIGTVVRETYDAEM